MTVLDAVSVLKTAEKITLGYGGGSSAFDKNDPLMLEAFGGFVVDEIMCCADGWYEINLAVRPFKET